MGNTRACEAETRGPVGVGRPKPGAIRHTRMASLSSDHSPEMPLARSAAIGMKIRQYVNCQSASTIVTDRNPTRIVTERDRVEDSLERLRNKSATS